MSPHLQQEIQITNDEFAEYIFHAKLELPIEPNKRKRAPRSVPESRRFFGDHYLNIGEGEKFTFSDIFLILQMIVEGKNDELTFDRCVRIFGESSQVQVVPSNVVHFSPAKGGMKDNPQDGTRITLRNGETVFVPVTPLELKGYHRFQFTNIPIIELTETYKAD